MAEAFGAPDSVHSEVDGTHHFLTLWHDFVLMALIVVTIALLVINHHRLKNQRALRESELRFYALAERSMVGIAVIQDDIYRYVNPRLTEMLGYEEEELVDKKGPLDVVYPDDRGLVLAKLNRRVSGVDEFSQYEARVMTREGEVRTVEVYGSRMIYHGRPAVVGTLLDVTERKRTQLELLKAHSDLSQIFNSSVPLYVVAKDYTVLKVNKTFCAETGRRQEDIVGRKCYDVWPDSACHTDECPMRLISGGLPETKYEREHIHADGHRLSFTAVSSPYKGPDGTIEGIIASFTDVSELKERERQIRESDEKARAQFKAIPAPTYIWQLVGDDFVFIDYNDEASNITGNMAQELVGKGLREIFPDRDDWLQAMLRCVREKTTVRSDKPMRYLYRRTGEERYLAVSYAYIPPDSVMVITVDITARTKAEQALAESEKKFRSLAETTAAAIFIYQDGRLVYTNQATLDLVGYSREELLSCDPIEIIRPDFRVAIKARARNRAESPRDNLTENLEIPLIARDGSEKWVMYTGCTIEYSGRPAVLGTTIDITERKKAEAQLQLAHAERYTQVKQIAGGVAHEIYNALFPAMSSLDKLKERSRDDRGDDGGRNGRLVELAEASVERAIQMTELVTQFSRLDSHSEIESLNLRYLFEQIFQESPRIDEIGARINLDVPENADISMNRLHAISLFTNIINNALDALEDRKRRAVNIKAFKTNGALTISISDSGAGIAPEIIPDIFNPFVSTKPRKGTGLGLAICKRIVDIYGGDISVESTLDRGTTFTILVKS
ncbi:MAG: PAS domain S-box protein [Candidatus Zixiibacteriota bacterium]|nr:MAG: PAS domain S-box protein [candidate division Zixibacteria bacterium]